MVKKRKTRKVGSSYTAMRTINGKRKKCRITKKSKGRYSVHVIGAKKKRKAKRKSTDYKYRSQQPWEITRKRKTKAKKHGSQKKVPRRRKTAKRKKKRKR